MKYKHYAPKADMMILEGAYTDVKREIERIRREKEREGLKVGSILFEESAFREAAHDFFARLRDLDQRRCGSDHSGSTQRRRPGGVRGYEPHGQIGRI